MGAKIETVGVLLRLAMGQTGFQRHGKSCYLFTEDFIWVVTPEQLWTGPTWAVRVALLDRHLAPDVEWPTDNRAHLQLELRFMTGMAGADAGLLDSRAVDLALLRDSLLTQEERLAALTGLALHLHALMTVVGTRTSLGAEYRAGHLASAMIVKDFRQVLENSG